MGVQRNESPIREYGKQETYQNITNKWKDRLIELGTEVPKKTENAIKRLEETEDKDSASYQKEATVFVDVKDVNAIIETEKEERVHSKVLQSLTELESVQVRLDSIIKREKWHRHRAGGWVGQAIYGANDGLGAVFGIVSGMAGYTGGTDVVLVAGLTGSLASALSMGSGAYLARKSEKEVYQAEIERERKEIEENPEEEFEELSLFYQLKGFSKEEAEKLANKLVEQPEHMLKVLASEELGLSVSSFPNPLREAFSASISTAIGGMIPVIPFFFTSGITAVILSLVISPSADGLTLPSEYSKRL